MTQPLEVAFVEVRFDTDGAETKLKKDVDAAFSDTEKSAKRTSETISAEFKKAGDSVAATFRDANGRLRDSNGKFVKDTLAGLADVSAGAKGATGALSGISGAFSQLAAAAGPIGLTVLAIAAIGIAGTIATVAVNGLIIAVAGLALLPGVILGAAAAFGIFTVATSGITDAFKELTEGSKKAGAGSAALANNQRQLADAQRGLTQAQKDLNKARQDALRDIERINVALTRSRATQARTADDLVKAEKLLSDTRKVGTADQIKEATIAYQEAKAAVDEANQSTRELEQDKKKADKNGVEGSEKVLAALEAIRDAQDRVKASQASLAAGIGAIGGQRKAFDGLTKSAQDFVRALVDAKKALGPLQDAIQEAFFKGTGDLIPAITANLLALKGPIVDVASAFNEIFRGLLAFLGSPEFKEAGAGVLKGLADFVRGIGPGVLAVVKGFTSLAGQIGKTGKNGKSLGQTLGENLGKVLVKLGEFLGKVDLAKVFEDAKKAFETIKPLIQPTIDVLKEVFIFFRDTGPVFILATVAALKLIATTFSLMNALGHTLIDTFKIVIDKFKGAKDSVSSFVTNGKAQLTLFTNQFTQIPNKIGVTSGRFKESGKKIIKSFFDGLAAGGAFVGNFAKQVANSIIRVFNDNIGKAINNAIQKLEDGINKIPGVNVDFPSFPRIPELEKGGLATQDTLARIGEKGRNEAVIPLENPRAMAAIANAIAKAGDGQTGGGNIIFAAGAIPVSFNGVVPTEAEAFRTGQAVAAGIASTLMRQGVRTRVRTLGVRNG